MLSRIPVGKAGFFFNGPFFTHLALQLSIFYISSCQQLWLWTQLWKKQLLESFEVLVVAYRHCGEYRDYGRDIDMGYIALVESSDFEGGGCYFAFVERKDFDERMDFDLNMYVG